MSTNQLAKRVERLGFGMGLRVRIALPCALCLHNFPDDLK